MALCLYAVGSDYLAVPGLSIHGLQGAPVRFAVRNGLAAAVSEIEAPPKPDEESLAVHHEVQQILFAWETILPFRFGTLMDNEKATEELLAAKRDRYTQALRRLAGKAEMAVRAAWTLTEPVPPPRDPQPGREFLAGRLEYLAALREHRRAAAAEAARIHAFLLQAALAGSYTAGRGDTLLAGDYLIMRDGTEDFIAQCEAAQARWPDYTFRATGPWPPAAFAAEYLKDERRGS